MKIKYGTVKRKVKLRKVIILRLTVTRKVPKHRFVITNCDHVPHLNYTLFLWHDETMYTLQYWTLFTIPTKITVQHFATFDFFFKTTEIALWGVALRVYVSKALRKLNYNDRNCSALLFYHFNLIWTNI